MQLGKDDGVNISSVAMSSSLLLPCLRPLHLLELMLQRSLPLRLLLLGELLQLPLLQLKLLQFLLSVLLQLFLELQLLPLLLLRLLLLLLRLLLLLLLFLRLLLLLLNLRLLLLLTLQTTLLSLFLLPPLLLLLLVLPLLRFLDRMEPNGPWCPSLDLRGLDPLVRDMSASRIRTAPGLITNSDGVAHSPRLGRLGGSLLTLEVRRFQNHHTLRRSRRGHVITSGRSRVGRTCIRPKTAHPSQGVSVLSRANPTKRGASHLPRALVLAPALSLLAIDIWACSNGLFNLSKEERA